MINNRKKLIELINEILDDKITDAIDFIVYLKIKHNKEVFEYLSKDNDSSMEFWDNDIDDEIWNNTGGHRDTCEIGHIFYTHIDMTGIRSQISL